MSGFRREDFVLRQVRSVAAMLARIIGLRVGGQTEEAKAELERARRELLGSQSELIGRVDAITAAMILGSRERIQAYADLVREEAEQESDLSRRALLTARATELAGEAAGQGSGKEAP
jgi:hypothetical protein